ncbi:MAG: hypothetical protein L0Z50_41695 [Verrucomicrobiales bacterium]|nr:hypothetical protein [Verrucomicrobiales bacterium]
MRKPQRMFFFISATVLALAFAADAFCQSVDAREAAAATPTPTPTPTPQGQVSQLSGRSFSRDRNGPRRDSLNAIKIVDHFNALLGGFEQGAGLGFGVEVSTASGGELKGFELYGRVLVSTRLYRKAEVGARVGNDNTRGEVWFGYLRRTRDNFFDIGPLTPDTLETNYQIEQRSYNGLFAQRFMKRSEAGVYAQLSNTGSFNGKDDKDPAIDTLFSGDPAATPVTSFLPGLNTNAKLFSYGVFAEIDLRNNNEGLVKGAYFYGRIGSVDGLDNGAAYSDFGWTEVEFDARGYVPIFSDKTSLALRAYADLKEPKRGSQIPFYAQSFFGTRNQGRGFDTFRFRANNVLLFSGELRQTVWGQNDENTKGLDIFVFTDVGQVWGDNRSKVNPAILANDKFDARNYRTGFGGGVQYRLNKNLAFRFEIGASNEARKFYFSQRPGF